MTLQEYQNKAMSTCMESSNNFSYMFLNLIGELGEFASKIAKAIRKNQLSIYVNDIPEVGNMLEPELKQECGDILWQLSGLCKVMGWSLEEIAQMNLDKLASRQVRGVINSDGDNR